MTFHDASDGGEADAGPRKLTFRVKTLEGGKETSCVLLIEAGAIVLHIEGRLAVLHGGPELDLGLGGLCCELPCVPEQVLQDDLDEACVRIRNETVVDYERHRSVRLGLREYLADAPAESREIDRLAAEISAVHSRKVEHIVDELAAPTARCQFVVCP